MRAFLTLATNILAYADDAITNDPALKYVDWKRLIQNIQVENPHSEPYTLAANSSKTIFDGSRTISADGTTAWTSKSIDASKYRLTATAGTSPGLRTNRNLNLSTHNITVTVGSNQVVTFASDTPNDFLNIQVGDWILIPGTTTGDTAGPFDLLNEGLWIVLAKDTTTNQQVQVVRPAGIDFTALTQAVLVASAGQVLAYSSDNIQIGDFVDLSGAFPSSMQNSFIVTMVAPAYFEFTSVDPLPAVSGVVAGANAVVFYTNGKRYVRVEADQAAVVRVNGDTGNTNRIAPWAAGDRKLMGSYEKVGPCWSLVVVNRSNQTMNINVISAE